MSKLQRLERLHKDLPAEDMLILSFEADTAFHKEFKVKETIAEILLQKETEFKLSDINSYTTSTIAFDMEHEASYATMRNYLKTEFAKIFVGHPFYYTLGKIAKRPLTADQYFDEDNGDHEQNAGFQETLDEIRKKLEKPS